MNPPHPHIKPGGPVATVLVAWLIAWLRWLSPASRDALARFGAALAWNLGLRRAVALDNLRQAFPEKSQAQRRAIARGAYTSLTRAMLESVTSDTVTDAQLEETVKVDNWGALEPLLKAKSGVLLASAHLGSWELFAEVMCRRGYKLSAVVRPLKGAFNAHIIESRLKAGIELILPRGAVASVTQAVSRGESVVQLVDQSVPGNKGVFVPFFGRLASTTPALSVAAVRTGKPLFFVCAVREGSGLRMYVEGPVRPPSTGDEQRDVKEHVAQMTQIVERYVRQYPEQWLWLHRRWKEKPPAT